MSEKAKQSTAWFTFGQCHAHDVGGVVFDHQCVVEITSADPRTTMFETFGTKWAMQYDNPPPMHHYPRGIIKLP